MKQNLLILVVQIVKLTHIKRVIIIILSAYLITALPACKKSDPICNEWTFYVPNGFAPNNDGANDIFSPKGTGVMQYEMKIFDANGQLLYTTIDLNAGWDGKHNGNYCPEGVYYYTINATDQCGYQHSYQGSLTDVR